MKVLAELAKMMASWEDRPILPRQGQCGARPPINTLEDRGSPRSSEVNQQFTNSLESDRAWESWLIMQKGLPTFKNYF